MANAAHLIGKTNRNGFTLQTHPSDFGKLPQKKAGAYTLSNEK
jgi:hypothetical protein